jgi:cell division protein ZipA
MSLRLLLIVIGLAIIAGVYFFTARRRRSDAQVIFGRRFNRELPEITLHHDEDDETEIDEDFEVVSPARPVSNQRTPQAPPASDRDEPDARPPPPRDTAQTQAPLSPAPRAPTGGIRLPPLDLATEDLPRVRNDTLLDDEPDNARRASDQLDLFGAESAAPQARGRRAARPAAVPETPEAPDDGVITLFIRAHERRPLGGPELVRALNAVGMRHGEMSIFHHFGAGDLVCDNAVFSAANMFEPGTFDLSRIEAFRTTGIVLFLQLPGPLEGPVAFELLLNTAQRLAELSGGELYATPQTPLDPPAIARLRRRAARFVHARR